MFNIKVLYAEDDPQSRQNYAFVLEEYFSNVYIAKDGKEALDIYYNKKPDILLLDISMPYINGLEVATKVRKENKNIPIIMLTAHADKENLLAAIPLKLTDYLLKPIDDKNLKKTIMHAIEEIKDKNIVYIKDKLSWNKINSSLFYKNKNIKLTKKEYKIISLLINSTGKYFSHDMLIIQIWENEIPDSSHDNKLHQLVYRFNRKIKDITNSDTQLIENSYTFGYRINIT
jgi:DNA-binding response OmpR family regulator